MSSEQDYKPTQIESFRVEGLHGIRTINIPIEANKLILVGENGTGKSTVANLMYFFLTRQWSRLLPYEFKTIIMKIDGEEFELTKRQVAADSPFGRILSKIQHGALLNNPAILESYLRVSHLSEADKEVSTILESLALSESLHYLQNLVERDELISVPSMSKEQNERLSQIITEQILYLPTYRRIERELKHVFHGLDMERFEEERSHKLSSDKGSKQFLELVEFGMQDVERTIQSKMAELKDTLRTGLNNLTGKYLQEIIQEKYARIDLSTLTEITEDVLDKVLERAGDTVLSDEDKNTLRTLIQTIDTDENQKTDRQKIIAHFFFQLYDVHQKQEEKEKAIQSFVKVCNNYLLRKRLVFNNTTYEITIQPTESNQEGNIKLQMLSSGEKQIVSLFEHIYLSGKEKYIVIIDEPELSLSVEWQQQFLPDILGTQKCTGLIAATHSPFISLRDDTLKKYTFGIEQFWE